MSERFTQKLERLRILSAQLHAVTLIGANHDIHRWHPDIRDYYLWVMTDMTEEVRDTVQNMVYACGEPAHDMRDIIAQRPVKYKKRA